ncbi:glycoside hydrolase family 31 protein [Paludisphaera rhizosphaerae]|uniref:glycoside hydrolase family 31 protein n=1 Tax=Paludisphaera rhizosphaerae TaxID=2711216 RepID=UPI0013EC29F5|nr:glycoside hydrolase family 31 protein [Paludisphaera rhizosphaerae]
MADVLTFNSGPLQARISETTGGVELSGPDRLGAPLATVIAFDPPVVTVGGAKRTVGRVVSSIPRSDGFDLVQNAGATDVKSRLSFPVDGVLRYEVTDWNGLKPNQTSITVAAAGDEHFYGFGEKFNALDQTGKIIDVLTFDGPLEKGDLSYKVAPWFVSTRGYGFHLDSTSRSSFDMRTAAGRYTVTNRSGSLAYHVVYGPALTEVVSRYTGLTGRPALPPAFAFGPWISSDIWRDGGEVNYAVTKFRERGIPVSGFVFDSPWEIAYNDFNFNIGAGPTADSATQFGHGGDFENLPASATHSYPGFKNLAEMMAFFQKQGLKVVCWMTPFVNTSILNNTLEVRGQQRSVKDFDAIAAKGVFVQGADHKPLPVKWWKGQGSPVDFTAPEGRAFMKDQLTRLLKQTEVVTKSGAKESAVGGIKTDDGEAATKPGANGNAKGLYIPLEARYHNGTTGVEMQNGYCLEYHKAVFEILREVGGEGTLVFARSGFTGTQAFPGCWAGDNEPNFGDANGLPSVIVAGLSAAMSGFSIWGHDVGGYLNRNFSTVSPTDLFIRWTQFGCFSPIMQMHRQVDGSNLRQYPWGYAEAGETTDKNRALENYRFYATLHTRLFPYLYTQAKHSTETGIPILRPLVLIHPDDPRTIPVQHVYYFGESLLVAPVIAPKADGRDLYLPEGDWIDFWTDEPHAGKRLITWKNPVQPSRPVSKIPVFVKLGAIIPLILGDDVQTLCDADYVNDANVKTWDGGLEIRVYPSGDSQFTAFDGTFIRCDSTAAGTTLTLTATSRAVEFRVLAPRPATGVRRDGGALPEAASQTAFDAASSAWRSDPAVLHIKFPHAGGTTTLTF